MKIGWKYQNLLDASYHCVRGLELRMVMHRSLVSIVLSAGLLLPLTIYAQQQKDSEPSPATKSDSQKPAEEQAPQKKSSNAEDNPFPEDVSRRAAEAAKQGKEGTPASPDTKSVPPGESSSASHFSDLPKEDDSVNPINMHDPKRAAEDVRVGKFYMDTEDWTGAYNRFQDALRVESDNADAAYGMAEAAVKLKRSSEAVTAYKKYLELDPDGPHAKASMKALKKLEGQSKETSKK